MTYERAAEILDPEHRETYESLEIVNEACRMGRAASMPSGRTCPPALKWSHACSYSPRLYGV